MARRKNPVFGPISQEIEAAVGGSMVVVDRWFDDLQEARIRQEAVLDLQASIAERLIEKKNLGLKITKDDREELKDVQKDINKNKLIIKQLDGRIAKYYKSVFRDLTSRFEVFKATPGSTVYAGEYRDATRKLALAKKQAQSAFVDIRPKISELRGSITALEEALSFVKPTGIEERVSRAKKRLSPPKKAAVPKAERWVEYVNLWKRIKPRAMRTDRYKTGGEKIAYAERQRLKVTPTIDVRFRQDVDATDLLMRVTQRKISRGEDVSKNIPRLKRMINSLEAVMRGRKPEVAPERVISGLGKLRRDLLAYRRKTRRSPKQLTAMQGRLATLKGSVGGKGTVGWSEQDRRTAIRSVRDLEALLKVVEPVGGAPVRRHRIPAKAITKRAGNPKKKKTKKKTARKVTPEWQRLIRRCQKLWDYYCERPGKKRLQDVLKHLEKMKASTSEKVLEERKICLQVAKSEAKRLKMK